MKTILLEVYLYVMLSLSLWKQDATKARKIIIEKLQNSKNGELQQRTEQPTENTTQLYESGSNSGRIFNHIDLKILKDAGGYYEL